MASTILKDSFGTTALTEDNELVMNGGHPCVFWSFRTRDLENWLTTLEEVITMEANIAHRYFLEGIYFSLKAAHNKHQKQHEEIVTEAPSEEDLMEYLAAYAASVVAGL
jgi:hypothetical protein